MKAQSGSSNSNAATHQSSTQSPPPSYHANSNNDQIPLHTLQRHDSQQEIQLPASAVVANNSQVHALQNQLEAGNAAQQVQQNNGGNHGNHALDRQDILREFKAKFFRGIVWMIVGLVSWFLLWFSPVEETYDCPQKQAWPIRVRYTCGPVLWSSATVLGMCAAKVVQILWKRCESRGRLRHGKMWMIWAAMEALYMVSMGGLVFWAAAWYRLCLLGCTDLEL